jgi:hypothetical protein
MKTKHKILGAALLGLLACDSPGTQDGNANEVNYEYEFDLPAAGDEMVRVDAMGISLLSTVLMNRDRRPDGADNKNQYQIDTPDVQNNPRTLLGFVHFLRALHKYWHDDLERLGFEPCSKKVAGVIVATPCTLQKLRFDESSAEGPRVIDAVLPDFLELDLDQPLRFPNGRTPSEPISDKVFALGFLKMGGKCPGLDQLPEVSNETKQRVPRDADGVPICTIETLSDIPLQVSRNDRAFRSRFPYLAEPWFYPVDDGDNYFWPRGERLETPE